MFSAPFHKGQRTEKTRHGNGHRWNRRERPCVLILGAEKLESTGGLYFEIEGITRQSREASFRQAPCLYLVRESMAALAAEA